LTDLVSDPEWVRIKKGNLSTMTVRAINLGNFARGEKGGRRKLGAVDPSVDMAYRKSGGRRKQF